MGTLLSSDLLKTKKNDLNTNNHSKHGLLIIDKNETDDERTDSKDTKKNKTQMGFYSKKGLLDIKISKANNNMKEGNLSYNINQ